MLYVHGRHLEYEYHVWHEAAAPRADVSVFTPDGRQHAAFELGVISPSAPALELRAKLRRTLEAWIEGAAREGHFA